MKTNNNNTQKSQKDLELILSAAAEENPNNSKKEITLQPVTKKKFLLKLIPFILFSSIFLAFIAICIWLPFFLQYEQKQKVIVFASLPVIFVIGAAVAFVLFDKAYCLYNIKHNTKMKKFCRRFVKRITDNGCFELRKIYDLNPLQLAWKTDGKDIIEAYKKWNPKAYEEDIKYYKEQQIGEKQ